MKKFIVVLMSQLLLCHSAFADYVVFSQYDGVNKWENIYVEVDNAADYVRPGVGFHPTQYGTESVSQFSTRTLKLKKYHPPIAWVGPVLIIKYGFERPGSNSTAIDTFTKASESSTFFDRRNTKLFLAGVTEPIMDLDIVVTDAKESDGRVEDTLVFSRETETEEVSSQEESEEIYERTFQEEIEESYESTLPAKAVVVVEIGKDLSQVVEDFFKGNG